MFEVVPLGWLCWRNFFWMAALQGRVVCGGGMEFVLTRGLSTPGRRRYHARALISWPIPQVCGQGLVGRAGTLNTYGQQKSKL
ncbi:hypothetical protein BDA96_09G275700 [Sorghum bicolor]|uniref:Uncharacterized protein n=2 Tax=Sorghum bicolor TaxID=4558 RepID=A0A1Z5R5B2_SORBI|nr:hypothetical protein BDA96_09G275700 [Sorghum bicolor]OQU78556.1 hypothetical protein SORBI_3009G260350 [Sorghum bicolor]